MRKIAIVLTLVAGCDSDKGASDSSGIVLPVDGSSSGDGESGSTGPDYVPGPYGQCEADASCHCEFGSCVEACEQDEQCAGSGTCIDGGCYIDCTFSDGHLTNPSQPTCDGNPLAAMAPAGWDYTCGGGPVVDGVQRWVCQWREIM